MKSFDDKEYRSPPVCVRVVDDHKTKDTDRCVSVINTDDQSLGIFELSVSVLFSLLKLNAGHESQLSALTYESLHQHKPNIIMEVNKV